DDADREIQRIVHETSGTLEEPLWKDLSRAIIAFSSEARRILAQRNVPGYSSRDLFRRHEDVLALMAKVINAGYQRAVTAQAQIEQRSKRLVRESFFLLGGCL